MQRPLVRAGKCVYFYISEQAASYRGLGLPSTLNIYVPTWHVKGPSITPRSAMLGLLVPEVNPSTGITQPGADNYRRVEASVRAAAPIRAALAVVYIFFFFFPAALQSRFWSAEQLRCCRKPGQPPLNAHSSYRGTKGGQRGGDFVFRLFLRRTHSASSEAAEKQRARHAR